MNKSGYYLPIIENSRTTFSEQATGLSQRTARQVSPYREISHILRKHRRLILMWALIAFALALGASLSMTPKYESVATIEINKENSDFLGMDQYDKGEESPADSQEDAVASQTEADILQSSSLIFQVSQQLGLEKRKEFALKPDLLDYFHREGINAQNRLPFDQSPARQHLVQKVFEKNLRVETIPGTRLIEVHFLSPDSQVAADVANTLVSDYIDEHVRDRYNATAQASQWLTKELNGLKAQVEASQAKLNEAQNDAGILGADETNNVVMERLQELNRQLTAAEANRILKETTYRLMRSGSPELISVADTRTGLINV
jgi:succinoglycan biosynthesis transport protein ExoP